jgi:anti-anti-sigma regulatory factor/predicted RNA-binding Zn-ribbon protein involved in translation (DUF1610 family)
MKIGRLDVELAGSHIALAGRIDDATTFGELLPNLPAGPVTIDTGGVTFVNSVGMREWIRLVRALRERGSQVILENVGDVLMTQMNLIPEFNGSVTITSFHAQYVCPACGHESAPVIDAVANAAALRQLQPPILPCPDCGASMELGDFPERYLTVFKP